MCHRPADTMVAVDFTELAQLKAACAEAGAAKLQAGLEGLTAFIASTGKSAEPHVLGVLPAVLKACSHKVGSDAGAGAEWGRSRAATLPRSPRPLRPRAPPPRPRGPPLTLSCRPHGAGGWRARRR